MKGRMIIPILVITIIIIIWRCMPCWTGSSCCPPVSIDQQNAVGTFMSLSKNPIKSTSPPEVAPGRIRAYRGEQVVWVFRNPSKYTVRIKLLRVWDAAAATGADIKTQVFRDLGGTVSIDPNCGIAALTAVLREDIEMGARRDTCAARTFYYDFLIEAQSDSANLRSPYDPELVIEGKP